MSKHPFSGPYSINTRADLAQLATYFHQNNIEFHPDTPIEDYIDTDTGLPTFTSAEASTLQRAVDDAFAFCAGNDIDIYDVMGPPYTPEQILRALISLAIANIDPAAMPALSSMGSTDVGRERLEDLIYQMCATDGIAIQTAMSTLESDLPNEQE